MNPWPDRSWATLDEILLRIGEHRFPGKAADVRFLEAIGLVDSSSGIGLTEVGKSYFSTRHVRGDQQSADLIARTAVLRDVRATAIIQLLFGVAKADRRRVETVLRSQGLGEGLTDRRLSSFLVLLDRFGIVRYETKSGLVDVLGDHGVAEMPNNLFISPETPFGNKVRLRRLLEDAQGHIYWLDKHFMPVAFDELWEASNGNRISDIRLLSLLMPEHEGKRTRRRYADLVRELDGRNISLSWRTIDSKLIRDTHDRWILAENKAWNVPNVNAIYTGQNSEMHVTVERDRLVELFESYWEQGSPIFENGGDDEPT